MHNVLLIEDNAGDARLIRELIDEDPDTPFNLNWVDRLSHALQHLSAGEIALVLLDLSLPDSFGLETLAKVYAHCPTVPIIVLTGNTDQALPLSAVQAGAQDYLVKGRLDRELLVRSMQYSIERKRYQVQLEYQANYDTLTGLPNRNLLHDRLNQSIHGLRSPHMVAIAFIDLDQFKFVNDSLGHSVGDRLLRNIGERLRRVLREGDTVARLGGDEFVLILNDPSSEEMLFRTMQRITDAVAQPIQLDGKELVVTCSAGISLYPQDGQDVDTLLKNADAAMYRAKERGRNNCQFYTKEMNDRVNERLALENALRRAIERQEFVLHYQPRANFRTGQIVGAEALVRWLHPDWGLVLPGRFIPIAEETGLIMPIGEFVLRGACRQVQAWLAKGVKPGVISVNLSARQFRQDGLVEAVACILAEFGVDPKHLELELTESMVMHDVAEAIATLKGLKSLGVTVSVDDFGTGYSSLAYLKDLPLDKLKIDRSFVQDIDNAGGLLAQAIISLGHNLGLKVVAEGVETGTQARFLSRNGCDEAQGFFYGAPSKPSAYENLLTEVAQRPYDGVPRHVISEACMRATESNGSSHCLALGSSYFIDGSAEPK